jgi:hypothetical protein
MVILLFLAATAAQPSPEALRLGRELAESGTLATVLPLMAKKETEELVAAHPELSAVEAATLRATASRVFTAGRERLMDSEARALAERLTLADLRAIAAFQRSSAAQHYRAATPEVIATMMESIGTMDFKGDGLKSDCRQTGKLCAP